MTDFEPAASLTPYDLSDILDILTVKRLSLPALEDIRADLDEYMLEQEQ